MVEAIPILALFVALDLLAISFGYDSREGIRSKEEELASSGVTWKG